jgi:hypothetical protein
MVDSNLNDIGAGDPAASDDGLASSLAGVEAAENWATLREPVGRPALVA